MAAKCICSCRGLLIYAVSHACYIRVFYYSATGDVVSSFKIHESEGKNSMCINIFKFNKYRCYMYEKLLAKSKTELYNINKIISKHNC